MNRLRLAMLCALLAGCRVQCGNLTAGGGEGAPTNVWDFLAVFAVVAVLMVPSTISALKGKGDDGND